MYFAFCEERSFSGSIESCFAPKNFGKTTVFCNSSDVFCQENWFVVRCFGENPYICIALNPEWETDAMAAKVAKGSLREWCGNFLLVNFLKNLEERK